MFKQFWVTAPLMVQKQSLSCGLWFRYNKKRHPVCCRTDLSAPVSVFFAIAVFVRVILFEQLEMWSMDCFCIENGFEMENNYI